MIVLCKKKPMNSKKKHQQIYRVAIIGAGRIGCGFDGPTSREVLTHAHAFSTNARTKLVAIVDTNTTRGKKESKRWGVEFFTDVNKMLATAIPDIVVIATPDNTHAMLLEKISLVKSIKLIVCEKPVAEKKNDVALLKKKVLQRNVPIVVNFSRRFDPVVHEVREALLGGKYGRIISANGIYTNGIFHNGSHMIDLARFLFGEMTSSMMHFTVPDYSETGPSMGGVVTFERCPQFYLMIGDERDYAVFELEIVAERKRLRFTNFGFQLVTQNVIKDPMFKGFKMLDKPVSRDTGLILALPNLVKHCVWIIDKKEESLSSLLGGMKTQEACEKLSTTLKSRKK